MSYCRKHNLSPATEGMINNQINIELSASHTYLALYSFFMNDKQSFHWFAKYFKYCSEEEMMHANKLIDYQNIRGGDETIRNITYEKVNVGKIPIMLQSKLCVLNDANFHTKKHWKEEHLPLL